MPPISPKRCPFCLKAFATQRAVNQHISASKFCLKEWHKSIVRKRYNPLKRKRTNSPEPGLPVVDDVNFNDNFNRDDTPEPRQRTPSQHSDVDDADDKKDLDERFIEPFPGRAGEALRHEKTCFENLQQTHQLKGETPWAPFANREEWGLAEWLMRNVGQKSTDEYLQLPIVS